MAKKKRYQVALSFANEDRAYVSKVAALLRKRGISVFYDAFEEAHLWGKNLYTYLQEVYRDSARYTVIFCSRHYAKKMWTSHERESAQERALQENGEYILPARFDETAIPGLPSAVAYIDLRKRSEEELVDLLCTKLGHKSRVSTIAGGIDDIEAAKQKIRLTKYQQVADAMAELEEAAARLAGKSRTVVPGENQSYPSSESRSLFQQAVEKLQRISRDRVSFSLAARAELRRTMAMLETMNLDFEDELFAEADRPRLRDQHQKYLEQNIVSQIAERYRAFCKHMADEFALLGEVSSATKSGSRGHETPNTAAPADQKASLPGR